MDAVDLQQMQNMMAPSGVVEFSGNKIRSEAIKEAALSFGARGGFAHQAEVISQILDKRGIQLDKVFDFSALLISTPVGESKTKQYTVLPPVITESTNTFESQDGNEVKISDRIFRIDAPAKFVTAAPTWREYLSLTKQPVNPPHSSLFPKTTEERTQWKQWIATGWEAGIAQADMVFDHGLNKLTRDYTGIVRYRSLLKQKMVSAPVLVENRLGVTGGGKEMAIDARTMRITGQSSLNPDYGTWQPIVYGAPSE